MGDWECQRLGVVLAGLVVGGDVGEVLVGDVVVGEVGDVVVGDVVVGDVGVVVTGDVVVGEVGVGAVSVGRVTVGCEGPLGSWWLQPPPPSTIEPSVVPLVELDPVSSEADLPVSASKPVSTPSPSARVATQLTRTVAQLTGGRTGSAVTALISNVSGQLSTESGSCPRLRERCDRVANAGRVSLMASWLRTSECE